jgi:type IV secretion system protein VirB11
MGSYTNMESSQILKHQIDEQFLQLGIKDILNEEGVTEIAINDDTQIFVEKNGAWEARSFDLSSANANILMLGQQLINGREGAEALNSTQPFLSITMPNSERCQIVLPPAADKFASLTIRVPSRKDFLMSDYENSGLFARVKPVSNVISENDKILKNLISNGEYGEFIRQATKFRKNIVFSGATGSGKTTFMKTTINEIDEAERIITIEDSRELFIKHQNKVHLVYPKDSKSTSTVTAKGCLEATLRMNPSRIILAEIRGDEAFYFIRACGNGHDGSITSCHAESPLMAYEQIALMIKASKEGAALEYDVIKKLIYMTIDISVHFGVDKLGRFISGIDFNPERKLNLLLG